MWFFKEVIDFEKKYNLEGTILDKKESMTPHGMVPVIICETNQGNFTMPLLTKDALLI